MKNLYKKARQNIENGGLTHSNIIELVNTIIRRKRLKLTVCQVMIDYFLSIFSYRTLRRLPVNR